MFGIFKRTKIKNEEIQLLGNVIKKLPVPYSSLINQIEDGLLRGVLIDASDIPGYVAFTYNSSILKKYDNLRESSFKLCNIEVYDRKNSIYVPYEIYVSTGTISGYSLGGGKKHDIDHNKIDITNFKIAYFNNPDYNKIKFLFSVEELNLINSSDIYEVELEGKTYYHLQDMEDGDFIGMDINKNMYKITHDPFQIILQENQLVDLLR